jgi:hypothetical protein
MLRIGTLPDGSKGFDANTRVTLDVARKFYNAGYRFAVRYVPRITRAAHDLSARETIDLLLAGLAVMPVQHVSMRGWLASASLGQSYGRTAAREADLAGIPQGVTVWCDLEEVSRSSQAADIIAYCNAWYDQVKASGYEPGLYVGYGARLTPAQLYYNLRFRRFWSAYNLNANEVPAVRGVQLVQKPYPKPADRVIGVPFEYDGDVLITDQLGSSPTLLIP